jgi:Tfp pilus assembly protein PilN
MEELLKQYQSDLEKTVKQIELLNKQKKTIENNLVKLAALANKHIGAIEALNKLLKTPKGDENND